MKAKPPLPPDKRPLHDGYNNWVFLRLRQFNETVELVFDSKTAWRAAIVMSLLCFGFGAVFAHFTKNWACQAIMVPTALLFILVTWYATHEANKAGALLCLHPTAGSVEIPRFGKSFMADALVLKLQIYGLSDDIGCELNLESKETGARYPLTKWLGKDQAKIKLCESLAKHGLQFQEEDLTAFAR